MFSKILLAPFRLAGGILKTVTTIVLSRLTPSDVSSRAVNEGIQAFKRVMGT
jgi:hypothetical protein